MKITIDARFLGPEGTGIGRYLENLLNQLVELDQKNDYVVFLRKNNYNLFNPKNANFKKVLTDARWYSVKEQILIPALLAREKPDLVHFPHINVPLLWPGNFVLTVHDLTKSEFDGKASTTRLLPIYHAKNLGYRIVINQAVRKAKKILVPSNFVLNKVAKAFDLKKDKFVVTAEAADQLFVDLGQKKPSEGRVKQVLASYGVRLPYLLYVGNLFPYKNIAIVLKALQELDQKISLVVVGSRNKFTDATRDQVQELGLSQRVKFVGFVPNEELVVLYQKALAFVFPSLSEGFGLPGLEAMACGCPVVAAKASSLPEVYGEAAVYFDPQKSSELAKKIKEISADSRLRNNLIQLGNSKVKEYSWRRLAEQTLSVYTQVGEKKA